MVYRSYKNGQKTYRKKRTMGYLLVGVSTAAFLLLVILLITYLQQRRKAQKYLNKTMSIESERFSGLSLDLIGMLDSYGVPYHPSVDKSFLTSVEETLADHGLLSSSLDLYGLYVNKTWELNGMFTNGVTIGEMKTMQNFGMDFVRHKYGVERIKDTLVYDCTEKESDLTVSEYYGSLAKPVVLYSCSANDLFYYFGTSLENMNLKKAWRIVKNIRGSLQLLQSEVESNLKTLTDYNPNAVILVMGLYLPSDHFLLYSIGNPLISMINKRIEAACKKYSNAFYTDVTCLSFCVLEGDFHPNQDGQNILADLVLEKLQNPEIRKLLGTDAVINANSNLPNDPNKNDKTSEESSHDLAADLSLDKWLELIKTSSLPQTDYVEYAASAEQILAELGMSEITYSELKRILSEKPLEKGSKEEKGLQVLCIERKLHEGYNVMQYTLRDYFINDKLSLYQ